MKTPRLSLYHCMHYFMYKDFKLSVCSLSSFCFTVVEIAVALEMYLNETFQTIYADLDANATKAKIEEIIGMVRLIHCNALHLS